MAWTDLHTEIALEFGAFEDQQDTERLLVYEARAAWKREKERDPERRARKLAWQRRWYASLSKEEKLALSRKASSRKAKAKYDAKPEAKARRAARGRARRLALRQDPARLEAHRARAREAARRQRQQEKDSKDRYRIRARGMPYVLELRLKRELTDEERNWAADAEAGKPPEGGSPEFLSALLRCVRLVSRQPARDANAVHRPRKVAAEAAA